MDRRHCGHCCCCVHCHPTIVPPVELNEQREIEKRLEFLERMVQKQYSQYAERDTVYPVHPTQTLKGKSVFRTSPVVGAPLFNINSQRAPNLTGQKDECRICMREDRNPTEEMHKLTILNGSRSYLKLTQIVRNMKAHWESYALENDHSAKYKHEHRNRHKGTITINTGNIVVKSEMPLPNPPLYPYSNPGRSGIAGPNRSSFVEDGINKNIKGSHQKKYQKGRTQMEKSIIMNKSSQKRQFYSQPSELRGNAEQIVTDPQFFGGKYVSTKQKDIDVNKKESKMISLWKSPCVRSTSTNPENSFNLSHENELKKVALEVKNNVEKHPMTSDNYTQTRKISVTKKDDMSKFSLKSEDNMRGEKYSSQKNSEDKDGTQKLTWNKEEDINKFSSNKLEDINKFSSNKLEDIHKFSSNKLEDIHKFSSNKLEDIHKFSSNKLEDIHQNSIHIQPIEKRNIKGPSLTAVISETSSSSDYWLPFFSSQKKKNFPNADNEKPKCSQKTLSDVMKSWGWGWSSKTLCNNTTPPPPPPPEVNEANTDDSSFDWESRSAPQKPTLSADEEILRKLSEDYDSTRLSKNESKVWDVRESHTKLNSKIESRRSATNSNTEIHKNHSNPSPICQGCKKTVAYNQALRINQNEEEIVWHQDCFKCTTCHKKLEIVSLDYRFYNDELYCMEHYIQKANIQMCKGCGKLIFDDEYTYAGGNYWHKQHFNCTKCGNHLVSTRYVAVDDDVMCFSCHKKLFNRVCQSCGKQIHPFQPFVEAGKLYWHSNDSCLKCKTCHRSLIGNQRYYRKGGYLYCNRYCSQERGPP